MTSLLPCNTAFLISIAHYSIMEKRTSLFTQMFSTDMLVQKQFQVFHVWIIFVSFQTQMIELYLETKLKIRIPTFKMDQFVEDLRYFCGVLLKQTHCLLCCLGGESIPWMVKFLRFYQFVPTLFLLKKWFWISKQ